MDRRGESVSLNGNIDEFDLLNYAESVLHLRYAFLHQDAQEILYIQNYGPLALKFNPLQRIDFPIHDKSSQLDLKLCYEKGQSIDGLFVS